MNTIIYIRTSTTEQNPENQLKDCLSINQWGDHTIYEEQQSAWKDYKERDVFNNVKKSIRSRKIQHLIVWDLDRIYRNRKKLIEFFQFCNLYKCNVYSYRQQWLQDLNKIPAPFDEIMFNLMIQIMGWIAEDESNKKSERVKAAVRTNRKGVTISYKGNKWGRKGISTVKRNKAIALRERGMTIRDIASEVRLSVGVVHKILSSNRVEMIV